MVKIILLVLMLITVDVLLSTPKQDKFTHSTKGVVIVHQPESIKEEYEIEKPNPLAKFTDKEVDLLCATIWGEAGNQPFEGKVLVAKVLLNRIDSGKYGDGVYGVVYAKSQFNCTTRKNFGYYTEDEKLALTEAILDDTTPNNLVWFANPKISTNRGFINRTLLPNKYKEVGDHVFSTNPNMEE